MKLTWLRYSNSVAMKVVPRAELTPEEMAAGKGKVLVDLSRSKNGKCIFSLEGLPLHDGHAPGWAADGSAPANSSNSAMTAQEYMERIRADIVSVGVIDVTEVEVKDMALPVAPYGAYEEPSGPTDYEHYGIGGAEKGDGEGEEDDSE